MIKHWFKSDSKYCNYGTWLMTKIGSETHNKWQNFFLQNLANTEVDWKQTVIILKAAF